MKLISYYDKYSAEQGGAQYLTLDFDAGTQVDLPAEPALPDIDGLPAYRFGASSNGKYTYISAYRYTLRDDMERKIRRRFFRRNNETGALEEMFTGWDRSAFQTNNDMFVRENVYFTVASCRYGLNVIYTADISESIDGENAREMWRTDGYPYGWQMSPDKTTLAFHIAGGSDPFNPDGLYAINTMDLSGNRKLICSAKDHLFFGPAWSPDGKMLLFQDCVPKDGDPGHHFADVVVCSADGSGLRRLTEGRIHYFGTAFGLEGHRMGGSSCPVWTRDSKIICSLMAPGSHPDCRYDASQRNHEECVFDPSSGRGGCALCLLDPESGEKKQLTELREGCWDFRPHSLSPDGRELLYTHSEFGRASEIRLLDLESGAVRTVTNGKNGLGADHARFL